jgi:hypothetical protein
MSVVDNAADATDATAATAANAVNKGPIHLNNSINHINLDICDVNDVNKLNRSNVNNSDDTSCSSCTLYSLCYVLHETVDDSKWDFIEELVNNNEDNKNDDDDNKNDDDGNKNDGGCMFLIIEPNTYNLFMFIDKFKLKKEEYVFLDSSNFIEEIATSQYRAGPAVLLVNRVR